MKYTAALIGYILSSLLLLLLNKKVGWVYDNIVTGLFVDAADPFFPYDMRGEPGSTTVNVIFGPVLSIIYAVAAVFFVATYALIMIFFHLPVAVINYAARPKEA